MEAELNRQRGVALPIALIMLVVMLFSAIYLMRATNNATVMAGNLAYERDISRRADFGLSVAYDWLKTTANTTKSNLDTDQVASGYLSTYSCATGNCYRDSAFWANAITTNDPAGNPVQYVIHRMCAYPVANNANYPPPNGAFINVCVQTVSLAGVSTGGVTAGSSLSSDTEAITMLPQIHYVITARVPGVKGASVVNQMEVMIGA